MSLRIVVALALVFAISPAAAADPPPIISDYATARPVVAMCGTTCPRKGCDLFAEAARARPDVDWLWVGGSAAPPSCFRGLANVFHAPQTEWPHRYLWQLADLFALSSRRDPCPYALLECFALGVPAVAWAESLLADHDLAAPHFTLLPGHVDARSLAAVADEARTGRLEGDAAAPGQRYVTQAFAASVFDAAKAPLS